MILPLGSYIIALCKSYQWSISSYQCILVILNVLYYSQVIGPIEAIGRCTICAGPSLLGWVVSRCSLCVGMTRPILARFLSLSILDSCEH